MRQGPIEVGYRRGLHAGNTTRQLLWELAPRYKHFLVTVCVKGPQHHECFRLQHSSSFLLATLLSAPSISCPYIKVSVKHCSVASFGLFSGGLLSQNANSVPSHWIPSNLVMSHSRISCPYFSTILTLPPETYMIHFGPKLT